MSASRGDPIPQRHNSAMHSRPGSATRLLIAGLCLMVLGAGLGLWILLGRGNEPFAVDVWWETLISFDRGAVLTWISFAMNWIGGGWFATFAVPIAVALILLLLRRPWSAAFFVAAELLSALVVQVLKHVFGRARPEDILVVSDFGSFPSGHVANAATIAIAVWVLLPRWWTAALGAVWIVLMAFTRTYLGAHWLSDTVGGALVGGGAALVLGAVFARLLVRERARPVEP